MARGAKTLSARPPPQAWLANCLDPTARVVTVSAKELGAMIEAREAKTSKSAPSRATAKSFRRATYSTEGVPAPPPGWRREVIPRKTVSGADAYYYSPCGKRMRSRPDVQRFLDKSKEQGKYLDVGIERVRLCHRRPTRRARQGARGARARRDRNRRRRQSQRRGEP